MARMSDFNLLSLCDRVRSSCSRVLDTATLVQIDEDALARLADEIGPTERQVEPLPRTHRPLDESESAAATLVFALDAINFGSGYHDIVRKRPGQSGAQTMASALTDYVSWTGPLSPERLQQISVDDCSQIMGQDLDGGALEELMSLFASALNDLGEWLEASGGAVAAVARADGSAEALAEQLTEMLFYRDVEFHHGAPVAFYKRAQITAADLARRVRPDLFTDLHRLTAFADNLVPHTLRMLGVIHIHPELAAAIESGLLLDPGGDAEVELRAAGVEAVERLAETTGRRAMDIDETLWTRGQDPTIKARRRHRCRSVFY